MYDKTARLPPAGSLREALFLTVWLRRAQAEAMRTKMVASGLMASIENAEASKLVDKFWDSYLVMVFPFLEGEKTQKDAEMVKTMQREVAKGPILFSPQNMPNPFQDRVKKMRLAPGFSDRIKNTKRALR